MNGQMLLLMLRSRVHTGYFPISLVKTQDLPPDRKYVFGYHPHGIIGMGAIANFGTEGTGHVLVQQPTSADTVDAQRPASPSSFLA